MGTGHNLRRKTIHQTAVEVVGIIIGIIMKIIIIVSDTDLTDSIPVVVNHNSCYKSIPCSLMPFDSFHIPLHQQAR